jgi:hypothetical protein
LAKVQFSNIQAQNTLSKQITARVLADLTSTKGKNKSLNNAYQAHIKKVSEKLITKGVLKINAAAKLQYNQALDEVGRLLASGFSTSGGAPQVSRVQWSPFSRKYFQRKLRDNPQTAGLFWKGSGDLSVAFNQFIRGHKGGITRSKPGVSIVSTGKKFRNTVFRFRIDFKYPSPSRGGLFFENIFLNSFFNAQAISGTGLPTGSRDLDKISFIEGDGSSNRHRPFIAQLMANRGSKFKGKISSILKSQTL